MKPDEAEAAIEVARRVLRKTTDIYLEYFSLAQVSREINRETAMIYAKMEEAEKIRDYLKRRIKRLRREIREVIRTRDAEEIENRLRERGYDPGKPCPVCGESLLDGRIVCIDRGVPKHLECAEK